MRNAKRHTKITILPPIFHNKYALFGAKMDCDTMSRGID